MKHRISIEQWRKAAPLCAVSQRWNRLNPTFRNFLINGTKTATAVGAGLIASYLFAKAVGITNKDYFDNLNDAQRGWLIVDTVGIGIFTSYQTAVLLIKKMRERSLLYKAVGTLRQTFASLRNNTCG